jgi:hypothetical protein
MAPHFSICSQRSNTLNRLYKENEDGTVCSIHGTSCRRIKLVHLLWAKKWFVDTPAVGPVDFSEDTPPPQPELQPQPPVSEPTAPQAPAPQPELQPQPPVSEFTGSLWVLLLVCKVLYSYTHTFVTVGDRIIETRKEIGRQIDIGDRHNDNRDDKKEEFFGPIPSICFMDCYRCKRTSTVFKLPLITFRYYFNLWIN